MNQSKAFVLLGDFEIAYNGRASSTLECGQYLVIYKPDKSISIHGAKAKALNYQNPNSELTIYRRGKEFDIWSVFFQTCPKFLIYCTNKNETLLIGVFKIIRYLDISSLSNNKIKLNRSEKELVQQIVKDIVNYLPKLQIISVKTEVPTPYGNIDIEVMDDSNTFHLLEVKRKLVSLAGCSQISRYAKYYTEQGKETKEYVAGPKISKNALKYCQQNNQTWLKADFNQQQHP